MPLLDPYATATEYKSRVSKASASEDAEILEQLTAASRLIERKLGLAPGAFNQSAGTVTRTFAGGGLPRMYLRDEQGQHFVQAIDTDGIAVDDDADGIYETTFSLSATWVQPYPRNAAEFGEPYDSLELMPFIGNTTLDVWPASPVSVRITGTWGWAAVPGMIRELAVKMARDVRDALEAGAAGELHFIDSNVAVRGDTWRLWKSAERMYGFATGVRVA